MDIGIIGLGRMGGNIARRLIREGHRCVGYDRNSQSVADLSKDGATGARDLPDLIAKLPRPRVLWLMLPVGPITESAITEAADRLEAGDIIIDGGNTFYKDDIRRAKSVGSRSIHYIDAGTSGGVWGLERGYCLMIGGETTAVSHLEPLFRALAPGAKAAGATPGRHATMRVGQPFRLEELLPEGLDRKAQKTAATDLIMRRIAAQLHERQRGVYG